MKNDKGVSYYAENWKNNRYVDDHDLKMKDTHDISTTSFQKENGSH